MKRTDIKNKNYESNEKRLKEEKIWDEFNESDIRHSYYEEEENIEEVNMRNTKNSLSKHTVLKNFDEEEFKQPQKVKNAKQTSINLFHRVSRPSIPTSSNPNELFKIRDLQRIEIIDEKA